MSDRTLDSTLRGSYSTNRLITSWLNTNVRRSFERDAFRHSRSNAARPACPLGQGRCDGERAGGAFRHECRRRLEASEGAGTGRPDFARAAGAVAAVPPRCTAPAGGCRLGRRLQEVLGAQSREPRCLPDCVAASAATQREITMSVRSEISPTEPTIVISGIYDAPRSLF